MICKCYTGAATPRMVAAHVALSKAQVATRLLAYGADYTMEAVGRQVRTVDSRWRRAGQRGSLSTRGRSNGRGCVVSADRARGFDLGERGERASHRAVTCPRPDRLVRIRPKPQKLPHRLKASHPAPPPRAMSSLTSCSAGDPTGSMPSGSTSQTTAAADHLFTTRRIIHIHYCQIM